MNEQQIEIEARRAMWREKYARATNPETIAKRRAYAYAAWHRNKDKRRDAERLRQRDIRRKWPWYASWLSAKQRCTNPKHIYFHRYGGRGIEFHLTKKDMEFLWARDNGADLRRHSIDRINNDGHYSLENCRLIEQPENARKAWADNATLRSKAMQARARAAKSGQETKLPFTT